MLSGSCTMLHRTEQRGFWQVNMLASGALAQVQQSTHRQYLVILGQEGSSGMSCMAFEGAAVRVRWADLGLRGWP